MENVKRITETLELEVALTSDDIFFVNSQYFDLESEQKIKLLPLFSKTSYIWFLNLCCLVLFVVSGELFGSFLSKANPNQATSTRIYDIWSWINNV